MAEAPIVDMSIHSRTAKNKSRCARRFKGGGYLASSPTYWNNRRATAAEKVMSGMMIHSIGA
jgi:hypothetical protein